MNASSARKEQAGWTCEVCGAKQGEECWGKVNHRYSTGWLAVFCQACHMKYDGSLHVSNSRRTL
jgi:hypothetical protein